MKFIACGDLVLGLGTEKRLLNCEEILSPDLMQILKRADVLLVNLECPLTDSKEPRWSHFPTLRASRETGKFLGKMGVDIASLANNHITDYGEEGLADTISVLEAQGIASVGAGWNQEEAACPLIYETNGLKIGIVALAQPEVSAAGPNKYGAGVLTDREAMKSVKSVKRQVDFCIAYLHYGVEFFEYPTPQQIRLSRALVNVGADMVIGHHPHVSQGYEFYKSKLIAYSLGNFIFDMKPSKNPFSRVGLLVQAEIRNSKIENIELLPIETKNGSSSLLKGKALQGATRHIAEISKVFNDRNLLMQKYYFTTRNNLKLHIDALFRYGIRRASVKRIADFFSVQFWPQILQLRIDFIRFLFSSHTFQYERQNRYRSRSLFSYWYLLFCLITGIVGLGFGRDPKIK